MKNIAFSRAYSLITTKMILSQYIWNGKINFYRAHHYRRGHFKKSVLKNAEMVPLFSLNARSLESRLYRP